MIRKDCYQRSAALSVLTRLQRRPVRARLKRPAHRVPDVYGVPEQWPHIRALYERAGFAHTGHTEVVYLAAVEDLPHPAGPSITSSVSGGRSASAGPACRRSWVVRR